jgi:hypothetical protein
MTQHARDPRTNQYLIRNFPWHEYDSTRDGAIQLVSLGEIAEIAERVCRARRVFRNRSPRFASLTEIGMDSSRCYIYGMGGRPVDGNTWIDLGNGYEAYFELRSFGDFEARICFR